MKKNDTSNEEEVAQALSQLGVDMTGNARPGSPSNSRVSFPHVDAAALAEETASHGISDQRVTASRQDPKAVLEKLRAWQTAQKARSEDEITIKAALEAIAKSRESLEDLEEREQKKREKKKAKRKAKADALSDPATREIYAKVKGNKKIRRRLTVDPKDRDAAFMAGYLHYRKQGGSETFPQFKANMLGSS